MKLQRKLIGLLLIAVGGMGLVAACGPLSGQSCTWDEDCLDTEVCYETVCTALCNSNADCAVGDECMPRTDGGDGNVCQVPDAPGDNNEYACQSNEDCYSDEFCNPQGFCQQIGGGNPEYYTIQVRDNSDAGRCGDTSYGFDSPGTKLMYVELRDVNGSTIAWGEAVDADIKDSTGGNGGNDFDRWYDVLDGSAPNLGADQCTEAQAFTHANGSTVTTGFRDDSGVSLGCQGSVLVQFKQGNNRINLDDSHDIVVGSYGKACNSQFGDDHYDVYLCTSPAPTPDASTCTVKLNGSRLVGINTVSVNLPD